MKVYKVVLSVLDFDDIGEDDVKSVIENTKYPNRCISPDVMSIDSRDIEWSDEHPLNKTDTHKSEFIKLFSESEND